MLWLAMQLAIASALFCTTAAAQSGSVSGVVVDPNNASVAGAKLKLQNSAGTKVAETVSGADGSFRFGAVDAGDYQLSAESPDYVRVLVSVSVATGAEQNVTLRFEQIVSTQQQVTVVASAPTILTPDPARSIFIHDQVLDANPGRPGAPISIPGLPIETASGGIKAPQYFAPGVAGDHGEPIAQYFQVAAFCFPTTSRQRARQRLCRSQLSHPADHQ